ncbi:MAG: hypothetical protein AABX52_00595 [Nanoarchaeota archaeon]
MTLNHLLDSEKEFLVIKHLILNSPKPEFPKEIEKIYKELHNFTAQRSIIPVFEGDYFLPHWSNQIIMAHGNLSPSKATFNQLRSEGVAAYLDEVIETILKFTPYYPTMILCFEAKLGTTTHATHTLISTLIQAGLSKAYIDSYYSWKIKDVIQTNNLQKTRYLTCQHHIAKLGNLEFRLGHSYQDIIAIPYPLIFFPNTRSLIPLIYGAVNNKQTVHQSAQNPNVLGIYWRGEEHNIIRIFLNSFGARKRF